MLQPDIAPASEAVPPKKRHRTMTKLTIDGRLGWPSGLLPKVLEVISNFFVKMGWVKQPVPIGRVVDFTFLE